MENWGRSLYAVEHGVLPTFLVADKAIPHVATRTSVPPLLACSLRALHPSVNVVGPSPLKFSRGSVDDDAISSTQAVPGSSMPCSYGYSVSIGLDIESL